jgi:hypothetical protein
MSGVEKQFDDNPISGANWSDSSGPENESNTGDVAGQDDSHAGEYSMQPPNPSVPGPEEAIEIGPDGDKR